MAFSPENHDGRDLGRTAKKKLTRLGSFSSKEVFRAWAMDSLLKPTTIETLMEVHEIDCLPAVLALRNRDIANLSLPIGQARLFEDAVTKLHSQYEYQEPPSPATTVDVEFPRYKSLLGDTDEVCGRSGKTTHQFSFDNDKNSENSVFKRENGETFCDDKNGTDEKLLKDTDCDDETQSGCACERWLFVMIFMPVLLIISLFGFIAWIIIWPVNRFYRSEKESIQIYKTAESLAKSPLKACHWAIGRRGNYSVSNQEEETKRNYGGMDVVEMEKIERKN